MAKISDIAAFIRGFAESLTEKNETRTFDDLARTMNSANFKNSQGKHYSEGKRGIPYILTLVYNYLKEKGDQEGADMVQNSFLNKKGKKHFE